MTDKPLIALCAGEASGDNLGAQCIRALRQHYPQARFYGIGGAAMRQCGMEIVADYTPLAVMGYWRVLPRLPAILSLRRRFLRRLAADKPDLFIGIDAPDFNLGIARRVREAGGKSVQYVAPSVWMWRQQRLKKIRRSVDSVWCLLPFEAGFFRQAGIAAEYVGHPAAQAVLPTRTAARQKLGLANAEAPIIALLPGSREAELAQHLPLFAKVIRHLTPTDSTAGTGHHTDTPTPGITGNNTAADAPPTATTAHRYAAHITDSTAPTADTVTNTAAPNGTATDSTATALATDSTAATSPPPTAHTLAPGGTGSTTAAADTTPPTDVSDSAIATAATDSTPARYHFIAAAHNAATAQRIRTHLPQVTIGDLPDVLAAADVAVVKSGTITLQTAMANLPFVMVYKMSAAAYTFIRFKKFHQPFFALPNLLSQRFTVSELIQHHATPEAITAELHHLLTTPNARAHQRTTFTHLKTTLTPRPLPGGIAATSF